MMKPRLGRVALAFGALLLASACQVGPETVELTDQQVCLDHFKNNPVERDRCLLPPELRSGSVPDARPQDLPVRSGQLSE